MYGCGEQEVGVASGSGWNLWAWLLGVVVRRYIDFLILLILYLFFFTAASLLFVHFLKCFLFLFQYFFVIKFYVLNNLNYLQSLQTCYNNSNNNNKTKLLVKPGLQQQAEEIFGGTGITVVTDGATYLGSPIRYTRVYSHTSRKEGC